MDPDAHLPPPPTMPLPAAKPTEIDVTTVYGLGKTLAHENENLKPRVDAIHTQFQVDAQGNRSADYPVAIGLANISPAIQSALSYQDISMSNAGKMLAAHIKGNEALANISMKIASEFSGVDDLNAADVDKIREITGIPAPEPPPRPSISPRNRGIEPY